MESVSIWKDRLSAFAIRDSDLDQIRAIALVR